MRDLRFFQQVVAGICVDNDPCVFDPRSFEASGLSWNSANYVILLGKLEPALGLEPRTC